MRYIGVVAVPRTDMEAFLKSLAGKVQRRTWVRDTSGRKGHYRLQWVDPEHDKAGAGKGQIDLFSEPDPKPAAGKTASAPDMDLFGGLPEQRKPEEKKPDEDAPGWATIKNGMTFTHDGDRKTIKIRKTEGGHRWIDVYGSKDPERPEFGTSWGKTEELPTLEKLMDHLKQATGKNAFEGDISPVKKSVFDSFRSGLAKAFGRE